MNEASTLQVALDGPAGAGKSSVAQEVAQRTNLCLVDTGAIYRAVTYESVQRGISSDDEDALAELARTLPIRFELDGDANRVFLERTTAAGRREEREVTREIRAQEISLLTSSVSRHPQVRRALLELQRALGRTPPGAVLEGRDIGTVVFPEAPVKIFLTASAEERARRRALELSDRGQAEPYEKVLVEVRARDKQDMERSVAPMKPAEDALVLDCTDLTFGEVVDKIVSVVEAARAR